MMFYFVLVRLWYSLLFNNCFPAFIEWVIPYSLAQLRRRYRFVGHISLVAASYSLLTSRLPECLANIAQSDANSGPTSPLHSRALRLQSCDFSYLNALCALARH